jgi:putative ATP-dependent endonuclease of OLD family
MVGPNGAGKSTILAALNLFFSHTNLLHSQTKSATIDDFHNHDTTNPIKITVTFADLNAAARDALAAYVRQDRLSVTAVAEFDPDTRRVTVAHYGQRLGVDRFRECFEHLESGTAANAKDEFRKLRDEFPELPDSKTKETIRQALLEYERTHQEKCTLIPSADNFYGFEGDGKLSPFIQWVYVPAVKDAAEEASEGKNTALGKLLERTVRQHTKLASDFADLHSRASAEFSEIINRNQGDLDALASRLRDRLQSWSQPGIDLSIKWSADPARSVTLAQPTGYVQTRDGDFSGTLDRMGHGLQRSYLFAILHELADVESGHGPTLVLGIEEPELYQHPPQARHLAETLKRMSDSNNQVLLTTHSPLFVRGEDCECVRMVSRAHDPATNPVRWLDKTALKTRLDAVMEKPSAKSPSGLLAHISQDVQPHLAEMFFTDRVVFVEGPEDVAYIVTYLHCLNKWQDFRRHGGHIVPVYCKSNLLRPAALAEAFQIPYFVVFDADSNCPDKWRAIHARDNSQLLALLGQSTLSPFPAMNAIGCNHAVFATTLADCVLSEIGDGADRLRQEATRFEGRHERMPKNAVAISTWLTSAFEAGLKSATLESMCMSLASERWRPS